MNIRRFNKTYTFSVTGEEANKKVNDFLKICEAKKSNKSILFKNTVEFILENKKDFMKKNFD